MTTKVTVDVPEIADYQVRVQATGDPDRMLQAGESADFYLWDDRIITVREEQIVAPALGTGGGDPD